MFFMAAHGLYFILVPLMAVLISYLEIWPERPIGAVFGDPSRLGIRSGRSHIKAATSLTSSDAHSLRFLVAIASQISNPFWH